jgi:hypothetical protein
VDLKVAIVNGRPSGGLSLRVTMKYTDETKEKLELLLPERGSNVQQKWSQEGIRLQPLHLQRELAVESAIEGREWSLYVQIYAQDHRTWEAWGEVVERLRKL